MPELRGQLATLELQGLKGQDEVQERIAQKRKIRDHIGALEQLMYPADEDAADD